MLNLNRFFARWRKPQTVPPKVASPVTRVSAHASPPSPASTRAVSVRRPTSGIEFHAELVNELKAEHAALVSVYTAVDVAMKKEHWAEVCRQLQIMRVMLRDHLIKERVMLYCYLQNMLPQGSKAQTLFHSFKVEMGSIGKAAFTFVDQHSSPEVFDDPQVRAAFRQQYATIGQVLSGRIHREETQLYPMYRPPSTPTH